MGSMLKVEEREESGTSGFKYAALLRSESF
jgi:hypothetical protein